MSPLDNARMRAATGPKHAPSWMSPMLATLAARAPSDAGWVYERKLDGIRVLAFGDGDGAVRLLSRNQLPLGFEEVRAALTEIRAPFVLDGEVAAFAGSTTSFQLLQQRGGPGVRLRYYVFDLLHWDDEDLRALPLTERKRRLASHVPTDGVVHLSRHREGDGRATLRDLDARLRAIETESSPFVDRAKRLKGIHFVEPTLVCQVGFGEWTRDGRLRHPRFLGLRADKSPRDVVRERPS